MGDVDRFAIDVDDLDAVIFDLERTEQRLESLTSDLAAQMRTLHETWAGLAARAHVEAHEEWTTGMVAMRQAMADLRAAARAAHGNYSAAAEANRSMWEQMR
ncbi:MULTISPECIES: WXG100 family type VII secretion target [unclassified Nocardioides]|uniref:WXG100 family type VII secretion target n=1 Tax=unclassified Nocardioides TaxID=2615069 RepID=UPI0036229266